MRLDIGVLRRGMFAASLAAGLAGCGGKAVDADAAPLATFAFPAAGVSNDNDYVGPFCCTGRTATVRDADGAEIGYSHFFGFDGGLNVEEGRSVASRLEIWVAGRSQLADPSSELVMAEVAFTVGELAVGETKSVAAGALEFDVVIDHVDIEQVQGAPYFDMGTVAATVTARPAAPPVP